MLQYLLPTCLPSRSVLLALFVRILVHRGFTKVLAEAQRLCVACNNEDAAPTFHMQEQPAFLGIWNNLVIHEDRRNGISQLEMTLCPDIQ